MSKNTITVDDSNLELMSKSIHAIIENSGDLGFLDQVAFTTAETKKRALEIMGLTEEKIAEYKKSRKLEECLSIKTKYHLLDPDFFITDEYAGDDFARTMIAVGANTRNGPILEDKSKRQQGMLNHETNYKAWLGEKLHLTKDEIAKLSVEDIDKLAEKYMTQAIERIRKLFESIPKNMQHLFRSEYFDDIHSLGSDQKKISELLMDYRRLEKERNAYIKKFQNGAIKGEADAIRNHRVAQFEIQRILALASLYRDREQNHEYQHLSEDESFIKGKLVELFKDKGQPLGTTPIKGLKSDTGFYDYTVSKNIYIVKRGDGGYDFLEQPPEEGEFMTAKLNGNEFLGHTDSFSGKEVQIPFEHIGLRASKDADSSVDKYLIKGLSSFLEVLDDKGGIIVLKSFDTAHNLENLLATELGTGETSWIEKMEFVGKHNSCSSGNYSARKGILKITYKAKDRKRKIKELQNTIKELEAKMKACAGDPESILVIKQIKQGIEYLKNRLKNLSYNLELEIQIFDLESYVKAEIDESSPSYHGAYKEWQLFSKLFTQLMPPSIYGNNILKKVLIPKIAERYELEGDI